VTLHDEPVLVTTAPVSPADDRRQRERRYLVTMAVRVVAFIVAIVFATGWIRVVAVILALVLPWVAVVLANAGPRKPAKNAPSLYAGQRPLEIGQRPSDE
jgi:Flp pilus assembly protein TadB